MVKQRLLSYLLLVTFAVSSFLALASLDNALFWDDEAHISIIARNYVATGQLSGWDGRNLVAYRNGTFLDANLNTINPPLDNLVAAAAFKLFGESTWAGRFPFVLCGLAALALFGLLLHHKFGQQKVMLSAFTLLALSPVFLLNIRTVRYNALVLLFSLGAYYAYERYRTTKQPLNLLFFGLSGVGLFFSNYLLFVVFFAALVLLALCLHRNSFNALDWKRAGVTAGVLVVAITPYAVQHRIWSYPGVANEPWPMRKLTLVWWNFRDLNLLTAMPWVIAIALAYFLFDAFKRRRTKDTETPEDALTNQQDNLVSVAAEWIFLSVAYILVLCLISPQTTNTNITKYADFRFLTPIVPFLFALTGITVAFIARRSLPLALVIWALLVMTNVLTITPFEYKVRWLLPNYLKEIINPYPTPYSEVINYLDTHATRDQTVLAWPEYNNYPLMFYTGHKYRYCCLLDENSPLPRDTIQKLNSPLSVEDNFPDWYIAFGQFPECVEKLQFLSRPHLVNGRMVAYRYQMAATLNVFWLQTQRPELPWHSFGPVKNFNPSTHGVFIFQRGPLRPVPVASGTASLPPS